LKLAANLTLMFTEVPLKERFQAAANAGFNGVEILMPEGIPADELALAAREAGVEIVLFNNSMGDLLTGGPGISGVPGMQDIFRESIEESRILATAFGAPCMHIGPSMIPEGSTREECLNVYAENLKYATTVLSRIGTKVLLEPMNTKDMPCALLTTLSQALEIIDEIDPANLGLQFDFYHVYMNGFDIAEALVDVINRVDHIQFSDSPGRCEPGGGKIDFQPALDVVRNSRYEGWLGAEYRPTTKTEDTLSWLPQFGG